MGLIRLEASDGEIFIVDNEIAKFSTIIKSMIEDVGITDDEVLPLPGVESVILNKVIEWINHYTNDENEGKMMSEEIPLWDANFLQLNECYLYGIIRAANYLNIKGLMEVACRTAANITMDKIMKNTRH